MKRKCCCVLSLSPCYAELVGLVCYSPAPDTVDHTDGYNARGDILTPAPHTADTVLWLSSRFDQKHIRAVVYWYIFKNIQFINSLHTCHHWLNGSKSWYSGLKITTLTFKLFRFFHAVNLCHETTLTCMLLFHTKNTEIKFFNNNIQNSTQLTIHRLVFSDTEFFFF